jgi:hypothetical protein
LHISFALLYSLLQKRLLTCTLLKLCWTQVLFNKHRMQVKCISLFNLTWFGTPRMYTLSLSKSIKRSNDGEFLKVKNVLFMYTMYYRQQRTSTLRIWKVCLHSNMYHCMRKCTLWSDNTCVFTRFHCVKNANTQLIWSSAMKWW